MARVNKQDDPYAEFDTNPMTPAMAWRPALQLYGDLCKVLYEIQEATGIPGLHTDGNSADQTPGVLERLQDMHDNDVTSLDAFRAFDGA